jgi:hypothetical protein
LGKFLEGIAELEDGGDAVDIHNIISVIRKVMEFCEKEEFIAWFVFFFDKNISP